MKVITDDQAAAAPKAFKTAAVKPKPEDGKKVVLQVSTEDCTGYSICVTACPVKSKTDETKRAINMVHYTPEIRQDEAKN